MAVAPMLALAATGFGVASSLMGGQAKAEGANFQAEQADKASRYGKIKADQTDQYMRENLQGTLANIDAVRAAGNTSSDSPTGQALRNRSEFLGDRDRMNRVDGINAQADSDAQASKFYTSSAKSAILGGELGAAGSLFSGMSGAYKSNGNSFNIFGS